MYLSDHDASKVAVLEGGVDWVSLGEGGSELQVQFVQLVHLLQSELCLVSPVCGNVPGGGRGRRGRGEKEGGGGREEVEDREREEGGRRINEVEGEGHRKGEREKSREEDSVFSHAHEDQKTSLIATFKFQHSNLHTQLSTHY